MRLLDQDVIHISPRKSTIPLTGRVLNPGYYEIQKMKILAIFYHFLVDTILHHQTQFLFTKIISRL